MYNPSQDLTATQNILKSDESILSLMDLSGQKLTDKVNKYIHDHPGTSMQAAASIIIAKNIIKRSQWDDLATGDKRLCVYFVPARKVRNESFFEEVLQIDCHVPAIEDYKAWQVQERVKLLLHKKKINNRYLYFDGQLGELSTMSGFFCCGSRYRFYRNI